MAERAKRRCRDAHDPGKLPVRRREVRDCRSAVRPAQLPLLAMPQAARRGLPQPGSREDRRLPLGRTASSWSNTTKARAVSCAASAANAARRSSTGRGRTGTKPPNFPELCPNTEFRWPSSTIPTSRPPAMSLSAARRRGSRSPTICRNMRNIRRGLEPRQVEMRWRAKRVAPRCDCGRDGAISRQPFLAIAPDAASIPPHRRETLRHYEAKSSKLMTDVKQR